MCGRWCFGHCGLRSRADTMTPFGSLVDPDVYCKNRIGSESLWKPSDACHLTLSVEIQSRLGSERVLCQNDEVRCWFSSIR